MIRRPIDMRPVKTLTVEEVLAAAEADKTRKYVGGYESLSGKTTCLIGGAAKVLGVDPHNIRVGLPYSLSDFLVAQSDNTKTSKADIARAARVQFPDSLDWTLTATVV